MGSLIKQVLHKFPDENDTIQTRYFSLGKIVTISSNENPSIGKGSGKWAPHTLGWGVKWRQACILEGNLKYASEALKMCMPSD